MQLQFAFLNQTDTKRANPSNSNGRGGEGGINGDICDVHREISREMKCEITGIDLPYEFGKCCLSPAAGCCGASAVAPCGCLSCG